MGSPDKSAEQTFRAGVGAMIQREDGRVLALRRREDPDAWQFPQGGLKTGEEPIDALYREVEEETGIGRAYLEIQGEKPRLLAYELPEGYRSRRTGRGQALYWFHLLFTGSDDQITLGNHKEFSAWRWMDMADLVAAVSRFRHDTYRALFEECRSTRTPDFDQKHST